MLPTDRISQLRKGELRMDCQGDVGGYHSLVEGAVQGEGSSQVQGVQTAQEQNLPPVGHSENLFPRPTVDDLLKIYQL